MGILRADRVSGLGGANAINGSVKFGDSYLRIPYSTPDDFTFDGNFTIEYWYYPQPTGADSIHIEYSRPTGYKRAWQVHQNHSSNTYAPRFWWWAGGSTTGSMTSSITMTPNNWYHIAWVRIGTTLYNYVDGVSGGSSTGTSGITLGDPSDAEKPVNSLNIGTQIYNGPQLMLGGGHISNLRIIKGEGIYTAAFTPPTTRLEKTSNTVLLCCQSPGDVTKEETGKIIETNNIANSAPPQASTFVPDVGEDHGTTFTDNTKFDTLSYMVPPGGTTVERGRGRAVFAGGYSGGPSPAGAETATISFAQIQSMGTVNDFGDLSAARWIPASGASSTRGTFGGGATPTRLNTIDYVTIATTSNATNFGDLTTLRTYHAGFSSSTRAISGGGNDGSSNINTIDYITIASAGNATDFGDMLEAKSEIVGDCSPTRGLFMGGVVPTKTATVDYITIATTGNEQAFGDLSAGTSHGCALSSNTRAIYAGGGRHPADYSNEIGYFTIATLGNETDFGDLITARSSIYAGTSNNTRGVIVAGFTPAPTYNLNSIEYITIASVGNAQDFGDITTATRGVTATSDSHGGIS